MTLLELCDPLFHYICRLNRCIRKSGVAEMISVRSEVLAILRRMHDIAAENVALLALWEQVELPLVFFADFMIRNSRLPFAPDWRPLAYDRHILTGDADFFKMLDATLADRTPAATERLAVYYVCMGLGFGGEFKSQPEYLRRKMLECTERVRDSMDRGSAVLLCSEAYEHVDTRVLHERPGRALLGIGIALVGLIVVVFAANFYLYYDAAHELGDAIDKVYKKSEAGKPAENSDQAIPPAAPAGK
jgi:type VI protein secretion system component VasF